MSRKICKEIKLSGDEKDIISQCAEKHKKRLGTYIRETAVDGKIKIYDLRQFDNLIMSFNRIGNEINPIAKVINSTGTITKKDIEDLKNCVSAKKYHRFNKDEANIVEEFRNKVTKNMNGPLIRDDNVINNKWQEYYDNNYYVYGAYDENDVLVSYMVYRMEGKEIKVSEMYFLNETSRQYLLNFLYRHRSQINKVELVLTTLDEFRNLLPSPRINYWQWPNKMGRVVMVKEALELLNIKDNFKGSYTLKINDKYAPWNDKIFQISCQNHHLIVNEKITKKFDYEITIQRLSQLILGHLSASEALSLELIKVNNSNKNDLLTKTFTKRTTMLWQEF